MLFLCVMLSCLSDSIAVTLFGYLPASLFFFFFFLFLCAIYLCFGRFNASREFIWALENWIDASTIAFQDIFMICSVTKWLVWRYD